AAGCDSIVTLDLTINNFVTGTDVQTACGSYTWIDGVTYTASNNTATYTYVGGSAAGCDSIVTLDLTINNFVTGTDVQTACGSYTWIDGVTYTASNNTATYTYVGGSAAGCDSIVTLDLTINNFVTGTDVQTACGSYTWIDGVTYTASNNTATYTYVGGSVAGCDSIVTLDLTINNAVTGTDVQTACGSYTWIDGITYTASTNTPTFTIANGAANGCDSIVTLDLTINNAVTGTDVQTACGSYTWIDGVTYTASNNTATYTYVGGSVAGCDSIVTLDLTINNFVTGTDVQTACGSYTWIDGVTYTASNNTATYTYVGGSAAGCDSIVTLDLTINNFVTGTDVQTACGSYTWIDGVTYTASNNTATYTYVGGSAAGCDSIVTLDLTINYAVTGIDVQTACGSYTWIDGVTYTASTNTPTFTIANGAANGCDSIVTLDLTVSNTVYGIDVQTAVGSYTWIDGITYTASTNTPTYTIANGAVNGCDSIVTLNLTIINNVTGVDIQVACDSYTWIDGVTYTSSTNTPTYTFVGGSVNGADSIVTLNLTINPTVYSVDAQTACDSYTWIDGVTYTASTNTPTYTIVGGATSGCDSVVTLNLQLYNTYSNTISVQICQGSSYTLPDGTIVNTTGLYTTSLNTVHGCDSIINTNLTIIPTIINNINTQICSGQTYTLPDGTLVSASGVYSDTLITPNGCDSIVTINLQVLPVLSSSIYAQICSGHTYTLPSGTIVSTSGIYNDTIIGSNGCDSIIQVNLNILASSYDTIQAGICNGQPYMLPDGSIVNAEGVYDVVFTNSLGCDSIVTTVLTSGANLQAVVQIASSPSGQVCQGVPVTFTAGSINGGTAPVYQWFVNGVPVPGQTMNEFTAFNLNDGDQISVQLTSNEPCVANQVVMSNIIVQEVIAPLTASVTILTTQMFPACSGTPITFTAQMINGGNNPTFQWFVNGVPVLGANNDTLVIDSLQNNDIITLNASSDFPCITNAIAYSNSIVVTLTQSIMPVINITADDTVICEQQRVVVTAHVTGHNGYPVTYNWYVNDINVYIGSDSIFSYISFNNNDIVYCSISVDYICVIPPVVESNTIRITVNPNPVIDMVNYQYYHNICDTLHLITSSNVANATYYWNSDAYLSCGDCIDPYTTTTSDTTWYFVTITDNVTGCFNIDSTVVYINPDPEVFIPTAFSPNGDNNNDILYVRGNCVKELSFKVYDRWGELVFKSHSISNGWDGTFKGQELQTGIYVYVIDYVLYNDKIKTGKGNVTLIR
ncbi:MAG: gliding motility-associated C-terminal domain-containing protein, partial [Bacteroidia bacterium]|nr:gliding motility-associated C-terminal domain-containing protein [Bacteroidia bacterium]